MSIIENSDVAEIFRHYPERMRQKLLFLRQLVLDTASETEGVGKVEETLKWGEPSYILKSGSTVRMDWKEKNPHQYAMYFHCKTKLVDTFKELYSNIKRTSTILSAKNIHNTPLILRYSYLPISSL